MTPAFQRAKTSHASDRAATVIGGSLLNLAISRAATVHNPTQSDHLMLLPFTKSSTILKSSFVVPLIFKVMQKSMP
jgi:hypothetical protein